MDPQSNGHSAPFPPPGQPQTPPMPTESASLRALKARLDIARQTVTAREDECDFIHAMHLTSADERDVLREENSRLKGRIAELEGTTPTSDATASSES